MDEEEVNKTAAVITAAVAVVLVIVALCAIPIFTNAQNAHRDQRVRTICIENGKQWIAGNCIAVP